MAVAAIAFLVASVESQQVLAFGGYALKYGKYDPGFYSTICLTNLCHDTNDVPVHEGPVHPP
jgi:hypothetical protein